MLRYLNKNRIGFNLTNKIKYSTAQGEVVKKQNESKNDQISLKIRPFKNEPFIKKLFTGKYEKDYLKFPELSSKELKELDSFIKPIESYYQKAARSFETLENCEEDFEKMKQFKLFSISAPQEFDGIEADSMKFARILESIGTKPGRCIELIIHNEFILKSLYMYGSPEQKTKYIRALSDGSLRSAFCFSESHTGVEAVKLKVEAKLDEKADKLYLNGSKAWVTLPSNLNESENVLLVVIAKVILNENQSTDEENFEIGSFLIERASILNGELKFKKQIDLVNGLSLYEVEFNNIKVKLKEARLGASIDIGYQLTTNLYENSRHLVGAVCVGLLKDLYCTTIEHSINNIQFNRSISEFQMIKERLSKIDCRLFAMESMTYLTAGIVDSFEIPDIALEGALTKIFCTEALKASVDDCVQILAMSKYKNLTDIQLKYLNAIDHLMLFLNTNDVLRHYVAFHGAASAANAHAEKLRKTRDFLNNPSFGIRLFYEKWLLKKQMEKNELSVHKLHEGIHPSLGDCAKKLEICSVKLVDAVESAFFHQGTDIVDYQLNMKRLAEMALEIYLMNACIARSSRSYSIGLHNCDFDFYLATVNVFFATKRFDFHYDELIHSPTGFNVDNLVVNIADRAIKEKRQSSSHCLNRTYD